MVVIIYGIKKENKYIYIGKTNKPIKNGSNISAIYRNDIRKQFINQKDIVIDELCTVSAKNWYDKKIETVYDYYVNKHQPLLNPRWQKNKYRGYWQNKKRDNHTLTRLSESKYIKVCGYNENGELIKQYNSIKEFAINIFCDYRIIKGSGTSKAYDLLYRKNPKNRKYKNFYWFKGIELFDKFKSIPQNINITQLIEDYIQIKKETRKDPMVNQKNVKKRYKPVIELDKNNNVIKYYESIISAGEKNSNNISISTIGKSCRFLKNKIKFMYAYSKHREKYLNNKLKWLEIKSNKKRYISKLKKPIIIYNSNKEIIKEFETVTDGATFFGLKGRDLYYYIINNKVYKNFTIKYKEEAKLENSSDDKLKELNKINNLHNGIIQINPQTGNPLNVYDSSYTAAIKINGKSSNIEKCCKGSLEEYLGYVWIYNPIL